MKAAATLVLAFLLSFGAPDAPVADAAMRGEVELVRTLLREGADVNAAQGDGMTALHWAAERGDAELASVLLYAGANLEAVTRIGHYTPLHVASRGGHARAIGTLLEAGAQVDVRASNGEATPLHLAAASGRADAVQALIDHGADVDAREGEWGQTPLIFAASWNRAEVIRTLLAAGADPSIGSRTVDLVFQSKLERAASKRRDDLLKTFLGESEDLPSSAELQAAVEASRAVLLSGELPESAGDADDPRASFRGPPTILTKGGLTPLLHAARQGHAESVVALLDGGADIDQGGGGDGTTPLLMAAINGQFDVALLLLGRDADPNIPSALNGATPLWAAVNSEWQPRTRFPQPQERALQQATYLDLMEALLEAGADPDARMVMHPWYMVYTGCGNGNCGLVDTEGSTAFWRAAYATDVPAMKLLVAWGADPDIPTKAPPQRQRVTPDQFLRRQNLAALTSGFADLDATEKVAALSSVRGDLPDSVQALYTDAALKARPDAIKDELVAHAERADSVRAAEPDPSGLPPVPAGGPGVNALQAASGVGYGEGFAGNAHRHVPDAWMAAVRYLVEELGMDVNARDHNGFTAVHNAASRGDNEMILYLVSKGGDVTLVARSGQTTADLANGPVQRVSPFPETVALLERLGATNNHKCMSC